MRSHGRHDLLGWMSGAQIEIFFPLSLGRFFSDKSFLPLALIMLRSTRAQNELNFWSSFCLGACKLASADEATVSACRGAHCVTVVAGLIKLC